MLSIGEFSKICEVTTKTLRYYEEIGLIYPTEINPENGYRYYAIDQLETMLFINRLKSYSFSLDEIKEIMDVQELKDERLYIELNKKKKEINQQVQIYQETINQINEDMSFLDCGKSIMSYLDNIDVQLVEAPKMCILSIRLMVQKEVFAEQYGKCFGQLMKKIQDDKLTMIAAPMVLFHSDEFSVLGLDTEFAIPVKEYVTGTRNFCPGLCIKTVLKGSYKKLPSVYAKQREWAEKEGYQNDDALFEVYITDPTQVISEEELVTEVFYPVKKVTASNYMMSRK
jgi:DNA-binding transcriptional MerR regulator